MLQFNTTRSNLHEKIENIIGKSPLSFKDSLIEELGSLINYTSYQILENMSINGLSGQDHHFDFIIEKKISNLNVHKSGEMKSSLKLYYKKNKEKIGIIVKNYKKPCGINVINEVATIFSDCNLFRVALCSRDFSKSAENLARRKNIILINCDSLK